MHIGVIVEHKSGKGFDVHFSSYSDLIQWAIEQEEKRLEWFKQKTGGGVPKSVIKKENVKTITRKNKK